MSRDQIIVAAPHFRRPARNGADILIEGRWAAVARKLFDVTIVGESEVLHYSEDGFTCESYANRNRSRYVAGARTVLRRSHYFAEKFWTKKFRDQLARQLAARPTSIVVASFPAIAALIRRKLLKDDRRTIWVESHNYEPEWFENFVRAGSPVSVRLAAKSSLRWLDGCLPALLDREFFLHVSERDQKCYAALREHRSAVAPVGAEMPPSTVVKGKKNGGTLRLIFLGSLSVKMNADALNFFAERFFPVLEEQLRGKLLVQVVGSAPSSSVQQLCSKNGWSLHADVDEGTLSELLQCGDFLIMPFAYSAGSKLKIVKALAHGLPILGTTCLGPDLTTLPYPCLASDEPLDWSVHVAEVARQGVTFEQANALRARAEMFSWDAITEGLRVRLQDASLRSVRL